MSRVIAGVRVVRQGPIDVNDFSKAPTETVEGAIEITLDTKLTAAFHKDEENCVRLTIESPPNGVVTVYLGENTEYDMFVRFVFERALNELCELRAVAATPISKVIDFVLMNSDVLLVRFPDHVDRLAKAIRNHAINNSVVKTQKTMARWDMNWDTYVVDGISFENDICTMTKCLPEHYS